MDTLARVSPAIFMVSAVMFFFLYPSRYSIHFLIYLGIVQLSNKIFKCIAKRAYGKRDSLPILGRGKRPEGACGCGLLDDNKPSTTFGMPSGHSQIAWSVATYLILRYCDIPQSIFLINIATYISFSRVSIGCHTKEQVIVGGLIGVASGILANFFEPFKSLSA